MPTTNFMDKSEIYNFHAILVFHVLMNQIWELLTDGNKIDRAIRKKEKKKTNIKENRKIQKTSFSTKGKTIESIIIVLEELKVFINISHVKLATSSFESFCLVQLITRLSLDQSCKNQPRHTQLLHSLNFARKGYLGDLRHLGIQAVQGHPGSS